jgi:hypothetical protein
MARRYVGIDANPSYVELARERVRNAPAATPLLLVGRPKYPGKDELAGIAEAGTRGRAAETKHKRRTFGRRAGMKGSEQLTLV